MQNTGRAEPEELSLTSVVNMSSVLHTASVEQIPLMMQQETTGSWNYRTRQSASVHQPRSDIPSKQLMGPLVTKKKKASSESARDPI